MKGLVAAPLRRAIRLGLLFAWVCPSTRASAQTTGVILGNVTAGNGMGLVGAAVDVSGTTLHAVTDHDGSFRLSDVPTGEQSLYVRRVGFRPDSTVLVVAPARLTTITVKLSMLVEALAPVFVKGGKVRYEGRLAGYYERLQQHNGGVFITREQIDQDRPRALSQLLQRIPGVTVVRLRAGSVGVRLRDRTCAPLIWLDGNALPAGEVDLDSFQPTSLQGIELYLGSTAAPFRYTLSRDLSNCGTILLWSRGGDTEFPQEPPSTEAQLEDLVASHAIFTADQVDESARLEKSVSLETVYPPALNAAHSNGLVIAEFVVSPSGTVEDDTFGVVSSTHPLFSEAVRAALKKATFRPAQVKGRPVRQLVHQPFEFRGTN
jgi:TonB family protein